MIDGGLVRSLRVFRGLSLPARIVSTHQCCSRLLSGRQQQHHDPEVQFETEEFVFFWKVPTIYSQWTRSVFTVDGVQYINTEQWMMACKARLFKDEDTLCQILKADNPTDIKKLGRAVKHYDDQRWAEKRLELVIQGNIAKFQQNPEMLKELLSTGEKTFAEASPFDRIWGIGMSAKDPDVLNPSKWKGLNLLGKALVETRSFLRAAASV
eukprot:TRINITY_DN32019_c0_g1_i1.p1 TRINITY_DN32019_c0_g1~~TRINITY_DN32019_c0_g1_i1.p1  ORF type:complete len:210 (-),score=47.22 TRINITY_DN32019_c0_g1_i1:655-1284(-)